MRILASILVAGTLALTTVPATALNTSTAPTLSSIASAPGVRVVRLLDRAEQVIGTVNRDGTLNLARGVSKADIATVRVLRASPTGAVTVLDYPASRFLAALAQARAPVPTTAPRPAPVAAPTPAPVTVPTTVRLADDDELERDDDREKHKAKKGKGKKAKPGKAKGKGNGKGR